MMMMSMVALNWDFMQLFLCTRDAGVLQSWGLMVGGVGDPVEGRHIQKGWELGRRKFFSCSSQLVQTCVG